MLSRLFRKMIVKIQGHEDRRVQDENKSRDPFYSHGHFIP
jgi:hypothetical protein